MEVKDCSTCGRLRANRIWVGATGRYLSDCMDDYDCEFDELECNDDNGFIEWIPRTDEE